MKAISFLIFFSFSSSAHYEDEWEHLGRLIVAAIFFFALLGLLGFFRPAVGLESPTPPLTWETKAICEGRRCCDFIIYSTGRIAPTGDCIWRPA